MTKKDAIVQIGAPVLRESAKRVEPADIRGKKITALIERMRVLLSKEKFGVGLAAPQVGAALRLFIIAGRAFLPDDADSDAKRAIPPDKVFINPEIIRVSRRKREMSEGCLSVRDKYGTVLRHEKATVRALDENGEAFTYHGSGLIAHIFQHECDHLDGTLFVDKAAKLEDWEEKDDLRKKYPPGEKAAGEETRAVSDSAL